MRKSKVKRRSDLIRKFHKGALKISIVDDSDITVGKRKNARFHSKSNMLIPRITMRAHLKFGYRIANHTPSMNVERRWLKEKLKEVDFPKGLKVEIGVV